MVYDKQRYKLKALFLVSDFGVFEEEQMHCSIDDCDFAFPINIKVH